MTASRKRFPQEFKDELCREVINTSKPIKDVATAYGVGPETLRNWLVKYRAANGGTEADLTVSGFTTAGAGTPRSVTGGPTKSTMVTNSQPWQRRRIH